MATASKCELKISSNLTAPAPSTISIAWRNLRYEVTTFVPFKLTKKTLLTRLNGSFERGTLATLMGPSGAGKTTLLNCLSGLATSGLTAESEIYVSSQLPVAFFIEQHFHETIVGQLTIRQLLQYAFRFKNGLGRTKPLMDEHISSVTKSLLLDESLLDRPFAKCSGGEQKRVAIAQELMSLRQPDLLFIDEVTTGLDSCAALEVIQCLSRLVRDSPQLTVVTSIHVPSAELLGYFDQLYVLSKGGLCLYSGPPGMLQIPSKTEAEPPIESLIRIASSDLTSESLQQLAKESLALEFAKLQPHIPSLTLLPNGLPRQFKSFSPTDLYIQLCRQARITFLAQHRTLLSQLLLFATLIACCASFFNPKMVLPSGCLPLNDQNFDFNCTTNFQLRENIHYICLMRVSQAFFVICFSTIAFSSIIKIFRNEHRNRWYSLTVFFTSTNLVLLLELALIASIIALVAYFIVSEHAIDDYRIHWSRLGQYLFASTLYLIFMQSIGQLVSVVILHSFDLAVGVAVTLMITLGLFDDYFFKTDQLKYQFLVTTSELFNIKYLIRYLVYIFYGLDRCDPKTEFSWVLAEFNIDPEQIGFYIGRVVVVIILMRLLALAVLYVQFNGIWRQSQRENTKQQSEPSSEPIAIEFPAATVLTLNGTNQTTEISEVSSSSTDKFCIGWRNLTLHRSRSLISFEKEFTKSKGTPILSRLNGQLHFGTLAALMGMSGAGKTSLLRVLNGQCRSRLDRASAFYLSRDKPIRTAFIAQEVGDHLMPGLTAKQSLVYASRLKNGIMAEEVNHEKIALNLLDVLQMADTAETKVEHCSGGERKRLALALELTSLVMPNLICIDEPTSGLDSSSAVTVISTLSSLAHSHQLTIVASIHQPNTELLLMFDQLYVLARGGVCVYSGQPSQIGAHLKQTLQTDVDLSPIETLIKFSCFDPQSTVVQQLSTKVTRKVDQLNTTLIQEAQHSPNDIPAKHIRFSLHSVHLLTLRYLAHIRGHLWLEWLLYTVLYLLYCAQLQLFIDPQIATVSGCWNIESDDISRFCSSGRNQSTEEKQMADNILYISFFGGNILMLVIMHSGLLLFREFPLLFNEHRNGWYSTGSWYLMHLITETLPMAAIILCYVYIGNIYATVVPSIYWHLVSILLLGVSAFQALCGIILLFWNLHVPLSIATLAGIYQLMTFASNLFIRVDNLSATHQILSTLSPLRYIFESIFLLQYGFGRCGPKEIQVVLAWMSVEDGDYSVGVLRLVGLVMAFRVGYLWMLIKRVNRS